MLHEVAEFENVIISCGGGTPCFFDNMDYLNAQGDTVYLKASPEVLCAHLKMARTERPLIKGKEEGELKLFIEEQLQLREPFYSRARYMLNVDVLDNRDKIQQSVEQLRTMLDI